MCFDRWEREELVSRNPDDDVCGHVFSVSWFIYEVSVTLASFSGHILGLYIKLIKSAMFF